MTKQASVQQQVTPGDLTATIVYMQGIESRSRRNITRFKFPAITAHSGASKPAELKFCAPMMFDGIEHVKYCNSIAVKCTSLQSFRTSHEITASYNLGKEPAKERGTVPRL